MPFCIPGKQLGNRPSGFSLVELVVVVVILAVIAAIAVPRIGTAGRRAKRTALQASLRTIRDAIDRYAADHNNIRPGARTDGTHPARSAAAFKNQLLYYTNKQGIVSRSPSALYPYGPYLRGEFPRLPTGSHSGNDAVTIVSTETVEAQPGEDTGWVYNPSTGDFVANATETTEDGIRLDDL